MEDDAVPAEERVRVVERKLAMVAAIQPAEVPEDLVLRFHRIEIETALEDVAAHAVRRDARAEQVPRDHLLRGRPLDHEQPRAGPEIDQVRALSGSHRFHFVEPQRRVRQPFEELTLGRRQPRGGLFEKEVDHGAGVLGFPVEQEPGVVLDGRVFRVEDPLEFGARRVADQIAPEHHLGDGVIAVEGRMERKGQELGQRGVARAARGQRTRLGLAIPTTLFVFPAAATRAGFVSTGRGHVAPILHCRAGRRLLADRGRTIGGENGVGDPDDLDHLAHRVHPDDVRSQQRAGGDGRRGRPVPLFRRHVADGVAQKRLA